MDTEKPKKTRFEELQGKVNAMITIIGTVRIPTQDKLELLDKYVKEYETYLIHAKDYFDHKLTVLVSLQNQSKRLREKREEIRKMLEEESSDEEEEEEEQTNAKLKDDDKDLTDKQIHRKYMYIQLLQTFKKLQRRQNRLTQKIKNVNKAIKVEQKVVQDLRGSLKYDGDADTDDESNDDSDSYDTNRRKNIVVVYQSPVYSLISEFIDQKEKEFIAQDTLLELKDA